MEQKDKGTFIDLPWAPRRFVGTERVRDEARWAKAYGQEPKTSEWSRPHYRQAAAEGFEEGIRNPRVIVVVACGKKKLGAPRRKVALDFALEF